MTDGPLTSYAAPCLLILGTEPACGKTVLACGISGALREQGYSSRVIKPLLLTTRKNAGPELAFIASVSQSPMNYQIGFLDRAYTLKETNWHNTIQMTRASTQVTFIELPGGVATPVCYEENNAGTITNHWRDTTDMAKEFGQPCLIVAKHQVDAIESLVLSCDYVSARGITIIGAATVETVPDGGAELERKRTRADFSVGFQGRTNVPYLGCIKYSPSISVPRGNQGNLVKMTAGIDLLPLVKALNIGVPAG